MINFTSMQLWIVCLVLAVRQAIGVNTCTQLVGARAVQLFGYCWFIPLTAPYSSYASMDADCHALLPGAYGAIMPDFLVNWAVFDALNTDEPTFLRVKAEQTAMTDGDAYAGWFWSTPDGQIAIDRAWLQQWEFWPYGLDGAKTYFPRWDMTPNGADSLAINAHPGRGLLDMQAYRTDTRVICAKRLHDMATTERPGVVGQGAELLAAAVLPSRHLCTVKCVSSFACLAASWHASSRTCQLHYVSGANSQLSVVAGDPDDRLIEINQ